MQKEISKKDAPLVQYGCPKCSMLFDTLDAYTQHVQKHVSTRTYHVVSVLVDFNPLEGESPALVCAMKDDQTTDGPMLSRMPYAELLVRYELPGVRVMVADKEPGTLDKAMELAKEAIATQLDKQLAAVDALDPATVEIERIEGVGYAE